MCEIDRQIESIRLPNALQGINPNSYDSQLRQIKKTLNPTVFHSPWEGAFKQHIGSEVIPLLTFMAEVSGDLEDEVTKSELDELWSLHAELRTALDSKGFGPSTSAFLRRQLESMSRALVEYPLRGVVAFGEAVDKAAVEWAVSAPHPDASSESSEEEKKAVMDVADFWKKAEVLSKRGKIVKELGSLFWGGALLVLSAAYGFGVLPASVEEKLKPYLKHGDEIRGLLQPGGTPDGIQGVDEPDFRIEPLDDSEPPTPPTTTA